MCTVVVFHQVWPAFPMVLAMNRDEFRARPAEGLALRVDPAGRGPYVGGRDLKSGGSWFAYTRAGVAVVTNDRRRGIPAPGERSRGTLVIDVAFAARTPAASGPGTAFGPCFLLAVEAQDAWLHENGSGAWQSQRLPPGAHVLGNLGLNEASDPVVKALAPEVEGLARGTAEAAMMSLPRLLKRRWPEGPFVDREGYGTRWAAILATGAAPVLREQQDPKGGGPWCDQTPLLAPLLDVPAEPQPVASGTPAGRGIDEAGGGGRHET